MVWLLGPKANNIKHTTGAIGDSGLIDNIQINLKFLNLSVGSMPNVLNLTIVPE